MASTNHNNRTNWPPPVPLYLLMNFKSAVISATIIKAWRALEALFDEIRGWACRFWKKWLCVRIKPRRWLSLPLEFYQTCIYATGILLKYASSSRALRTLTILPLFYVTTCLLKRIYFMFFYFNRHFLILKILITTLYFLYFWCWSKAFDPHNIWIIPPQHKCLLYISSSSGKDSRQQTSLPLPLQPLRSLIASISLSPNAKSFLI